uniref:Phorbol-ester/DAG-type domain-containing protein n=1 Tax=Musca domestica TaxID=7370 RepID=T1PLU9_MUSDO
MSQKAKEKLLQPLFQKEKCRELVVNFKKSIELWFLSEADDTFKEIQSSCFDIILYGLVDITHQKKPQQDDNNQHTLASATGSSSSSDSSLPTTIAATTVTCADSYHDESDLYSPNKIIDDFEWVLNAVNIRNSATKCSQTAGGGGFALKTRPPTPPPASSSALQRRSWPLKQSLTARLTQWLCQNLRDSANLFVFLQYLVSDKELLEEHYTPHALLRHEEYVNAIFIGMSAFETHQYGLLKQIDTLLKEEEQNGVENMTKHKRCNSQPNVIVLPEKKSPRAMNPSRDRIEESGNGPTKHSTVLLTIRKTKSLPDVKSKCSTDAKDVRDAPGHGPRPRCKTIADIKHKHNRTPEGNIPQLYVCDDSKMTQPSNCDDDPKPSTSHNSTSNRSPTSSLHLNSTASTTSSSCSVATSVSSSSSKSTTRHIQLINTDDIKIWTDHSWEQQKNKSQEHTQSTTTPAQAIPSVRQRVAANKSSASSSSTKSLSPLNSFFSSLFSTPPSYTSWYTEHSLHEQNHQIPEQAIDSINSDSRHHGPSVTPTPPVTLQSTPSSLSSAVLDKFLPIYGKKLRKRNAQNLFDEVSTALDYSTPFTLNNSSSSGINTKEEGGATTSGSPTTTATMKNCQSLTRFLQMSQSSRNNTELEKENAHFRISEAIISAIEHIKWNKQVPNETLENLSREATPLATDYLSSSEHNNMTATPSKVQEAPCSSGHEYVEGEHVPYAEDVSSVDLLTAEVVGLSLISKFDEKHLPKVSELKWLVSDEDTPQNLLPMPDLSGNNPDEHVIHSVTRGTKYWAPPRQQIIFTDHPSMERKELLKKQNYRCAGCGMRVSPQYVQSFRYCTYLGKYHCTGCHRNQISATPAKILQSWDFKCYPVSVFAYRLLEQMYAYPLFYVPDLNPALYFRSKSLLSARNRRLQLKYVKDFIRTCRFALREQNYFETIPDYITSDIDNWSMSDFIDARSNCLQRSIDELITKCENHIFNCVLCTARGFLCEYCNADSVIYPWDSRVVRCDRCGTCFHRNCWKSMALCCRCQRIDKRQEEYESVHNV